MHLTRLKNEQRPDFHRRDAKGAKKEVKILREFIKKEKIYLATDFHGLKNKS